MVNIYTLAFTLSEVDVNGIPEEAFLVGLRKMTEDQLSVLGEFNEDDVAAFLFDEGDTHPERPSECEEIMRILEKGIEDWKSSPGLN